MRFLLLGSLLLFFGSLALKVMGDDAAAARANGAAVRAQTILVVAGVYRDYKASGGTIPEGASAVANLALPAWVSKDNLAGIMLFKAGQREFVVATHPERSEGLRVRTAAQQASLARLGIASEGRLLLMGGTPGPEIPGSIPDGAVVLPL